MPEQQPVSRSILATNTLIGIVSLAVIPLLCLWAAGVPPVHIISFIGAILAFQPVAASIGLVLGFPPDTVIITMFFTGLGAILVIFTTCDLFASRWERLARLIQKVHAITKDSALFQKYGILMFFLFIWVPGLGLYGCTLVSWLFGWRRAYHIGVLMAAWMTAVLIVTIASMGILTTIS